MNIIPVPLPFCFIQALKQLADARLFWRGQSTESTDSSASIAQKHPSRHNHEYLARNLATLMQKIEHPHELS